MAKRMVAIEEVERLMAIKGEINSLPLEDIVWTRDGIVIPVDQETLDHWKFVGLSNLTFAEMHLIEYDEVEE